MADAKSIFSVKFNDDSTFRLPKGWKSIFIKYFGSDPDKYGQVADRLRFLVEKYVKHKAWPSKFDGIGLEREDEQNDSKYDNPEFYWETWDSRERNPWDLDPERDPTHAEIAEQVMYQSMRVGILGKIMKDVAKKTGKPPVRVVTPEQFLKELRSK